MMVDSYQVLIDNGNNSTSTDSDTQKLSTILRKNMNETSETSHQHQQQQHQQQTDTDSSETINAICDSGDHGDVRRNNDEIMCGPSPANHGTDDQTISVAKAASTATTVANSSHDDDLDDETIIDGCAPNYGHDLNPFQNGLTDIFSYNNSDKCSAVATKNSSKLNRNSGSVATTTTTTETGTSGGKHFGAYEVCTNLNTRNDEHTDGDTETNSEANCARVIDAVWHEQRANSAALPTTNNANRKESEYSGGTTIDKASLLSASTNDREEVPTVIASRKNRPDFHHKESPRFTNHHQFINNNSCSGSGNSAIDMESRKVEPLRININREPIKTKIKLGQQPQASSLSPSTAAVIKYTTAPGTAATTPLAASTIMPSANLDSSDDTDDTTLSHIVPKITIKPIRPPPSSSDGLQTAYEQQNDDNGNEKNHHRYHHSHNHHSAMMIVTTLPSALTTTATNTATPTSTMDGTSSMTVVAMAATGANHHGSAPQEAIPKLKIKVDSTSSTLQNLSSFSATNSSSCSSSSISNSSSSSISQVQNSAGAKEAISLVSDEGVKVTLKPLSEPPLPKLTIKTNTATDTAEVVVVNNTFSARAVDAEDNLSTCSSGSTSSFSSNSSSGSTTATPCTSQHVDYRRQPPPSKKSAKQLKLGEAQRTASPVQKSSTRGAAKSIAAAAVASDENIVIPKVTIKPVLNPNDGPDVCPSEQPRVTPKIILKPIPKPIDKPLEIITAPGSPFGRSSEANESQQSPRIILKINKNATSQTTEAILLTKPSSTLASPSIHTTMAGGDNAADSYSASPKSSTTHNDLKRMSTATTTNAKKLKLMIESEDDDDVVHLLSSDSDSDELSPSIHTSMVGIEPQTNTIDSYTTSPKSSSTHNDLKRLSSTATTNARKDDDDDSLNSNSHSNSDLRSILSRPQMKIPPPLQNSTLRWPTTAVPESFASETVTTAAPASAATDHNAIGKASDVIDLCHDSNDQLIPGVLASPQESAEVTTSPSTNVVATTVTPPSATTASATDVPDSIQKSSDHNQFKSGKSSFYFYGVEEKRPESFHPLLQQHIDRANVLEAMRNAANDLDKSHTANGANNNSTSNDNNFEKSSKRKSDLLLDNDGSSSDCIVIEDTGSEPFPFGSGDKVADQNGQKKESVDRDSGVDVSSSVKSISGDGHDEDVTPVKRPRGRPRKDGTPAGSIKNATSKKQQQLLLQQQQQLQQQKQQNDEFAKRKFAGVLMSQQNSSAQNLPMPKVILQKVSPNNAIGASSSAPPIVLHKQSLFAGQQTTILTASGTMTITSTTAPTLPHPMHPQAGLAENKISIVPIQPIVPPLAADEHAHSTQPTSPSLAITITTNSSETTTMKNLMTTPQPPQPLPVPTSTFSENSATEVVTDKFDAVPAFGDIETTPVVAVAAKERKRRIIIDDDDESPTFNPLSRSNKRVRGRGRKGRGGLLRHRKMHLLTSPEKAAAAAANANSITSVNAADSDVFTSPEGIDRRKFLFKDTTTTPALQVFEEDTRMSADSLFASPNRNSEFLQNDESQSSLQSSTSATVEGSTKKIRSKIEVADPEGKTDFTVDMIAEYDWPPPKGCCPSRNRDTFMIQEQIAEYLGVKSFKRKYPDLPRRMVEMEERNYLMEKGMVSEKMCDLGLTAVLASDVLDIMHTDFYEKYEEYRRYLREKQIRDLAAKQKTQQAGAVGKNLSARENAMRAAASWNSSFNKSRKENRRECLDLQNFVIQIPEVTRALTNRPTTKPSSYPLALVPGQFQEFYRQYSAAELLCYPINTVIADPYQLDRKLREYYNKSHHIKSDSDSDSDDDSDSDSSSNGSTSDSDESTSSSSDSSSSEEEEDDEKKPVLVVAGGIAPNAAPTPATMAKPKPVDKNDRGKCKICNGLQRSNRNGKPELFVRCSICQRDVHPSCVEMPSKMVKRVNEYAWQCSECKHCIKCRRTEDDDKMLFCDQCDRGYHIYCIGLRKVPNGQWHCAVCTVCTMCGARRPEGHNNPNLTPQQKQKLLAVAKWTHEYQLNPVTNAREHSSMLCTSCVAIKHSAAKNVYFN